MPYKVVTKNADFITSAAKNLIPRSNPTEVDIRPRAYMVEWKRDSWQPFSLYLFGPCIDGVKMTMLPGLYVHKQTRMWYASDRNSDRSDIGGSDTAECGGDLPQGSHVSVVTYPWERADAQGRDPLCDGGRQIGAQKCR